MNGFAAVREWFSADNLARRQAWLETRQEALQLKGGKEMFRTVFGWIWKAIKYLVLAILLVWVMASAIEDNAVAIALALPPVVLIGLRRFWGKATWLAAGILTLYGVIGIGAFIGTCLGGDAHVGALYGTALAVGFFGAMVIDSKASLTLAACVAVALLATLVVALLGEVINVFGSFPTTLITHLTWAVLGLVAVVLAFVFARSQAAMLILVTVSAAGFHRFIWEFDGARRQDVDILGLMVIPDQAVYGFLLLVAALAVIVTPARFPKKREVTEPEDDTEEIPELGDATREHILDRLYQADKTARIFTQDGTRFLARALARIGITETELADAGVTIEAYADYAARRAIDEIREADAKTDTVIIRKDGKVNPTKLAALGFRKDFLDDHEITKEELLTGELSD